MAANPTFMSLRSVAQTSKRCHFGKGNGRRTRLIRRKGVDPDKHIEQIAEIEQRLSERGHVLWECGLVQTRHVLEDGGVVPRNDVLRQLAKGWPHLRILYACMCEYQQTQERCAR